MTSNNMYRVGDFVYFEVSASEPYQIRKIEELNKTNTGAVEAKVVCFYRRRDLSQDLVQLADKHHNEEQQPSYSQTSCTAAPPYTVRHLQHRVLFLSHHLETLPATHIRGKCTVTLHSETEPLQVYLSKDDSFFYQLVYDPVQKTLQADRGVIRKGDDYQAEIPSALSDDSSSKPEGSTSSRTEELIWRPDNALSSSDVDRYLLLAKSLATFGRAFHPANVVRQPSLSMSVAAAGRDSTLQLAMDMLHTSNYQVTEALAQLTHDNQPILRLDEMEQWSASEGNLFEEALEKYGKAFYDIQADFLPWKHTKSLIQFYYMWKTTDHYVQQRRIKASEAEHHLKQVYIPNYNKPNTSVLYPSTSSTSSPGCEACPSTTSAQWFALGPSGAVLLKVCADCWAYWKRYADLKTVSLQDKLSSRPLPGTAHQQNITSTQGHLSKKLTGSNNPSLIGLAAAGGIGFVFLISPQLRRARQRSVAGLVHRRRARRPFRLVDIPLSTLLSDEAHEKVEEAVRPGILTRKSLLEVLHRLFPNLVKADFGFASINSVKNHTNKLIKTPTSPSATDACLPVVNGLPTHDASHLSANNSDENKRTSRKRPADEQHAELISKESKTSLQVDHARAPDSPALTVTKRPTLTSSDPQEELVKVNSPNPDHPPAPGVTTLTDVVGSNPVTAPTNAALIGPKRRLCLGGDEGQEVVTVMFRCHDALKRARRRRMTIAELRVLGRRPIRDVYQLKSVDVSHPGLKSKSVSAVAPVNGLLTRSVGAVAASLASPMPSPTKLHSAATTLADSESHQTIASKSNGAEAMATPNQPAPVS